MTRSPNHQCIGFALLLLLAACQHTESPTPPARTSGEDQVRAASVTWDEAHNAADLARLMDLYADEAVSMPHSRPALDGRAAIDADFRQFFAEFTATHATSIVSIDIAGDWAIERGTYALTATPKSTGAAIHERGKHIVIRRKVGDVWKIRWEIWNTDAPLRQAP